MTIAEADKLRAAVDAATPSGAAVVTIVVHDQPDGRQTISVLSNARNETLRNITPDRA